MAVTSRPREASFLTDLYDQIKRIYLEYPLLGKALAYLAALQPLYQILIWVPSQWARTDKQRDLWVYYDTALKVAHHQPLYHPMPWVGPDINPLAYLYPPQFALLLMPLDRLSYHDFCAVWYVLLVASFWVFAWTLAKMGGDKGVRNRTLMWGLLLAATPGAYEAMSEGQIDPLVWALFGLALVTRYNGFFLAVMTQVKLFGAVPLAISMYRETWRNRIAAIVTLAAGFALGAAVFGPHSIVDWIRWSLPLPGQGHFDEYNLSISFLMLRIGLKLGLWQYHGGPLPAGPHLFLQVCQIIGILGAIWATRKMPAPKNYIIVLIAALLCSPTCWYTYDPLVYTLVALGIKNRETAA